VIGSNRELGVLEGVIERQVKVDPTVETQAALAVVRQAVIDLSQFVCENRRVQDVVRQLLVVCTNHKLNNKLF
jgi:hypothetical protein